jgi:hypothetical protein
MTATTNGGRNTKRWAYGGLTFLAVYNNLALDKAANDTAADFVREKIAEIVKDPQTAKLLQPNNHPIGRSAFASIPIISPPSIVRT